jgi:hypothetical protein
MATGATPANSPPFPEILDTVYVYMHNMPHNMGLICSASAHYT